MAGYGFVPRFVCNPAEGVGTPITFTGALAAGLLFNPVKPVRIIRWGVVITTAVTAAGNLQLRGDVYPKANAGGTAVTGATTSNSGTGYNSSNAPTFYVDTAGGTATVLNANLSNVTQGVMVWHNVNPQAAQTGGYYPAPDTALIPPGGVDTQLVIFPGQSFQITNVNALTAGAGVFFLLVEEQAFVADFNNNAMVLSGYPSSNGTTPTSSWPFAFPPINAQS